MSSNYNFKEKVKEKWLSFITAAFFIFLLFDHLYAAVDKGKDSFFILS
jgi:hypothetical protein